MAETIDSTELYVDCFFAIHLYLKLTSLLIVKYKSFPTKIRHKEYLLLKLLFYMLLEDLASAIQQQKETKEIKDSLERKNLSHIYFRHP